MKKIFALLFFVVCSAQLFAYNNLRVGDPRNSWYTYQGTIEEATISVKPKGIYMEYGLYLTFSARNTPYSSQDSLEVTFNFDLPTNAIVTDSWLWIGDTISRAKIMDQWTANAVYESIVQRRQDPSVLKKLYAGTYQLKVFPMQGNQTRKVKITYLVPTDWKGKKVSSKLPFNLLTTSLNPLPSAGLITWCDSTWINPLVTGASNLPFSHYNSPDFGDYYFTEIASSLYYSNLNLSFNSPMSNGVFVGTFTEGADNYYQLAISPQVLVNNSASKKIVFLMDYDQSKTNYTKQNVYDAVKFAIRDNLTANDSFNLIFSNFMINRVSSTWLPADSATVENIFSVLNNPMSSYSNLSPLIANGVDFIQTHGNNGKIMLLSSSDQYGNSSVANNLINDIVGSMNPDIPFYISDYQTQNYNYNYINGMYYYGNEYFYTNLANITIGSYFRSLYSSSTLSDLLQKNMDEAVGIINSFNLYTSVNTGYCFGRFATEPISSSAYINKPILQVGKFIGGTPFNISISGEYQGTIYNNNISVNSSAIHNSDSIVKGVWAGLYIKDLESQAQTNSIKTSIINKSIHARVLSLYTAFLCLEDSTYFCDVCEDESSLIGIEERDSSDSVFLAVPNPFTDEVKITIAKQSGIEYKDCEFVVYNLMGEEVYRFNYFDVDKGDKFEFIWNGKQSNGTELSNGMYLFYYKRGDSIKQLKIIKN